MCGVRERGAPNPGQSQAHALVQEVRAAFADEHAAQARQVELIERLCEAFSAVDASGPVIPGQERLLPTGADGTPLVAEHLVTELAPQLRMSIESAWGLISESMTWCIGIPCCGRRPERAGCGCGKPAPSPASPPRPGCRQQRLAGWMSGSTPRWDGSPGDG